MSAGRWCEVNFTSIPSFFLQNVMKAGTVWIASINVQNVQGNMKNVTMSLENVLEVNISSRMLFGMHVKGINCDHNTCQLTILVSRANYPHCAIIVVFTKKITFLYVYQ